MNFFKNRTEKQRDKMKRRGMRSVATWVPDDEAEWLKVVFSRIGENSVDGQCFRNFLKPTLSRRRAPGRRYHSNFLEMEIDGPYVGAGSETAPIGGRIYNRTDTLYEFRPDEALDFEAEVKDAIGRVLSDFIKRKSLEGKVRNNTGVITDPYFLRDTKLEILDDESFERRECLAVQDFIERSFARSRPIVHDDSIFRYLGIGHAPSRCQIVEDRTPDGNVFFAFIHIPYGGTSPTNLIEDLCSEIRRTRLSDIPEGQITWLDVYPEEVLRPGMRFHDKVIGGEYWKMDLPRIQQVTFEEEGFSNPTWSRPQALPESMRAKINEAICRRIDKEAQSHFDVLNQERQNPKVNKPALKFVMPQDIREGYGQHYADIMIEDEPDVRLVIALIPASPAGMGYDTEPLLAFSRPGSLDFMSQPETERLAEHWQELGALLSKDTYSWNDEDFQAVCARAEIDWETAKRDFEGQTRS